MRANPRGFAARRALNATVMRPIHRRVGSPVITMTRLLCKFALAAHVTFSCTRYGITTAGSRHRSRRKAGSEDGAERRGAGGRDPPGPTGERA
jgi:hypothetical protein